jgi:hypothetical protein
MLLVALLLSGCANSRAAGDGQPCVDQPNCIIGCVVKDNRCEKEKDDAG